MQKIAVWISDDVYLLLTYISIASFVSNVDIPVVLIYCGHNTDLINVFRKSFCRPVYILELYPSVPVHSYNQKYKDAIINRLVRMYVASHIEEDTIVFMFDSDTAFTPGIRSLFDQVSVDEHVSSAVIWGCIDENQRAIDNRLFFARPESKDIFPYINEQQQHQHYRNIYGDNWATILAHVQLNNGVIAFYCSREVAEVWRDYFVAAWDFPEVNPGEDQVPLAAALAVSTCETRVLDDYFNSQGIMSGNFAVFHACAGRWKDDLQSALTGIDHLSDYGRIVEKYLAVAPEELKNSLVLPGYLEPVDTSIAPH